MCIAIYKPENRVLLKRVLKNCFLHHHHGAGYVMHNARKRTLTLHKGFFSFNSLWNSIKDNQNNKMIVHFRWATHGEHNKENCHPFMVNDKLAFAHNGVIRNVKIWDKTLSDTWHFCEAILKPLISKYPDIWKEEIILDLLKDYIGANSKLIFLNNLGEYKIVNAGAGEWSDECWFSNNSYGVEITKKREKKETNVTVGAGLHSANGYNYGHYNISPATVHPKSKTIDADLKNFYKNKDRSHNEMLVETLFKECHEEENVYARTSMWGG